jgi:hypothetical protein
MTAPALFDSEALDGEQVLVAWLAPLRRSAVARISGDPLPFCLITQIGGHEDPACGTADLLLQVDTLCDRTLGYGNAANESRLSRRRMSELQVHNDTFTMADGTAVGVDYVTVAEAPRMMLYEDETILRYMGRYEIGLSYVSAP